jgi:O-acetyl-ADP-ribose deacetylase (regulator of RNase III)
MRYTTGNLLEAEAEALVNTVNTVGVMGKGIALMFKEKFPENYRLYEAACKAGEVKVGHVTATERSDMYGPKWIVNFPTKQHWRNPSKLEWIAAGLRDLRRFILTHKVQSIAIPPLGAGNGGLNWNAVKPLIEEALGDLPMDVIVYEPTATYQNVAKRRGVEKLTPARALIAEIVRRYWILGIECTILEVQKLAYFIEREINAEGLDNVMSLKFAPKQYGPYSDGLRHLLDSLDGSFLHCDKRISDAGPMDVIRFADEKQDILKAYLGSEEAKPYQGVLTKTADLIDGFESPLGMELLATVDWLIHCNHVRPDLRNVIDAVGQWPGGQGSGDRKKRIFKPRLVELALERLAYRNELAVS